MSSDLQCGLFVSIWLRRQFWMIFEGPQQTTTKINHFQPLPTILNHPKSNVEILLLSFVSSVMTDYNNSHGGAWTHPFYDHFGGKSQNGIIGLDYLAPNEHSAKENKTCIINLILPVISPSKEWKNISCILIIRKKEANSLLALSISAIGFCQSCIFLTFKG